MDRTKTLTPGLDAIVVDDELRLPSLVQAPFSSTLELASPASFANLRSVISILTEHPHFMLVSKPAGMFTQAAPGVPSLATELAEQLRIRDEHPGTPYLGLPHRLDRGTSGIVLLARNQRALKRFNQQFQARSIVKTYLATVTGSVSSEVQTFEDYLRKVPDEPKAVICGPDEGKLARLRVRGVAEVGEHSLVQIQLLTGRMHQIRLQLASRGFPIVGETIYGTEALGASGQPASTNQHDAFWLHALRLEFRHPQNGTLTIGTAPLPERWEQLPELHEIASPLVQRSQADDGSHPQAEAKSWALE